MLSSFIAMFAGALLSFAFAPFNVYAFAFISPAILCYLWMKTSSPRVAFYDGFYYGFGFFAVGVSWIYVSVHNFGNASTWLAFVITLAFVCLLALFFATQGYVFRRYFKKKSDLVQCVCVFPVLWLLWEWLRSVIFTGFPWLLLGYSQTTSPLHGLAPIVGTYGLSLCVVLVSGSLVLFGRYTLFRNKCISLAIMAIIALSSWLLIDKTWTQAQENPIQASLIQGNFDQFLKWDSKSLTTILDTYKKLSEENIDSSLIVWPEAAIPYYPSQLPHYIDKINTLGQEHNTTFIVGAPTVQHNPDVFHNSMLMLGNYQGQYNKKHLVPFGEYTPWHPIFGRLMDTFSIPMSDFSPGTSKQPTFNAGNFNIATFICYEIIFPHKVLAEIADKQLIIVINDDGWFGQSLALSQHLQMAQMAALQTNRYVLFCSTTGLTAIINPEGAITKIAPTNQQTVLTGSVTPMSGKTPLMHWGYIPTFTLAGLLLLIAVLF